MRLPALLAACFAVAITSGDAFSREIRREVVPNRDQCWVVKYYPRVEQINTKGQLLADEQDLGVGYIAAGQTVRQVRAPAVYLETVRTVEEEHYSLVPTACTPHKR